jgi:hypothetical protein
VREVLVAGRDREHAEGGQGLGSERHRRATNHICV